MFWLCGGAEVVTVKTASGRRVLDARGRRMPEGVVLRVDEKSLFIAALIRCGDLVRVADPDQKKGGRR